MTRKTALHQVYAPTHDEHARQAFVGALKAQVNGPVEDELARLYDHRIGPDYKAEHGREPGHRDDVIPAFEKEYLYQSWGSMVYTSQDLLWETVGDTVDRLRPAFEARAREILESDQRVGTLKLNADLDIPKPIADVEIHRQPGEPGKARKIVEFIDNHFPDLKPNRILDMGCGIGTETVAYKQRWPAAEVHGRPLRQWGRALSALRHSHGQAGDERMAGRK